jgi:hypothetical protein
LEKLGLFRLEGRGGVEIWSRSLQYSSGVFPKSHPLHKPSRLLNDIIATVSAMSYISPSLQPCSSFSLWLQKPLSLFLRRLFLPLLIISDSSSSLLS